MEGNKARKRFEELLEKANRAGMENLTDYLENNGYFEAPSSGAYHNAFEGGNLEHSLNVTETMLKLRETLDCRDIPEESVIIVGLFHDLGKADYYNKPQYVPNILKSGKLSDSKPYETNKDRLNIPHEISSLHILSRFIPLTEEEVFAVTFHNGLYVGLGRDMKGGETKLQQLLHFADMWASRFMECEYKDIDNKLF